MKKDSRLFSRDSDGDHSYEDRIVFVMLLAAFGLSDATTGRRDRGVVINAEIKRRGTLSRRRSQPIPPRVGKPVLSSKDRSGSLTKIERGAEAL
jgi:hypothetical protein